MAKAKSKKITLEEALVPVEEQPYKVPKNWCWIHLLDSFDNVTDSKKKLATKEYLEDGEYPIIDQGQDFIGGYTDDADMIYDGELPIVIFGDHTRCIKYIDFQFAQGADGVKVLKPKQFWNDKAFYYAMQSIEIPNMGYRRHYPLFKDFCIPLPPLAEQKRIVEQIESLFSKLDEAKEKIECLLDSKKVSCNSVLNKAFTGKLTAKWRENNNIKFETWEYINFEKIIVEGPQNGMYKPKTSYGSGTKILRIDCFYDGKLEPWEKLKRLEITDEEKHTYLLSVNDIVVNRVNSMPYLGKSALIRKLPEQCVFESNMMRIKINIRKANPEYVIRYLNSSIGLQELRKNAKQAVNQASINQQDVKMVKIALPSLEEQNEIVKIITSISNKDEAILNKAEAVIEEIDLMKKSILAKAFRGELGTNISKEKNSIEVLKKLIEEESK